jgi:hypothetical protein
MRPSTGLSSGAGEAGSWSGCLPPGCQQLLVGRWRHFLAGCVPPPGVVVLDPGRHLGPRCCLCVPITSSTSCDQPIFVDHATDVSLFSDAVQVEDDRLG